LITVDLTNLHCFISEKRIQCHIQATNKFPTKLGLIIERAKNANANEANSRLKTIANPK